MVAQGIDKGTRTRCSYGNRQAVSAGFKAVDNLFGMVFLLTFRVVSVEILHDFVSRVVLTVISNVIPADVVSQQMETRCIEIGLVLVAQ